MLVFQKEKETDVVNKLDQCVGSYGNISSYIVAMANKLRPHSSKLNLT